MDYTWTVSTPTSSSGKLLMSVVAVRHRFLVAVFVVAFFFFCPCWCKNSSLSLTPGKKKNCPMSTLFQAVFLFVSLVGLFRGP